MRVRVLVRYLLLADPTEVLFALVARHFVAT